MGTSSTTLRLVQATHAVSALTSCPPPERQKDGARTTLTGSDLANGLVTFSQNPVAAPP